MKTIQIPSWAIYGILSLAAFLFVFFFSCTTSPLYEHHPFWFHGDSGVFQEMGICILHGGTPYVDLFDHKGPVLWFIQALGLGISYKWGLTILQTLFLFATLLTWYRSALLLTEHHISSISITLLCLLPLMAFYQRGNLCEEWSLPFISLPLLLYLKRWKSQTEDKKPIYLHSDVFVLGICVGVIAMIRLNNTAPMVGFALWHLLRCLQCKEYRRLWTDIAIVLGGIAMVFVLCTVFFLIKEGWNGVGEMIYGCFLFNLQYMGSSADLPISTRILHYIPAICALLITLSCAFQKNTAKNVALPLLTSYVVSLLAIGRFAYIHYMTIFLPLFIISAGITIGNKSRWTYVLWLGLSLFSVYLAYDAVDLLVFRLRGKKANTELNDGFHRFVTSLPEDERNSIYNAGLNHMGAGLFADERIYQCNRIISRHYIEISPKLKAYEETHSIEQIQPTWVIMQGDKTDSTIQYLITHYMIADTISGGEYAPIWCWKKTIQPKHKIVLHE